MANSSHDRYVAALYALCLREGGHKAVAAAAGVSADNLRQILQGAKLPSGQPRSLGRRLQDRITRAFPDWLNKQHADQGEPLHRGLEAHLVSHPNASDSSPVSWETLMKLTTLPPSFCIEVPDDAMLPRVRRGDVILFSTRETPRSGDGVLVRDRTGRLYFRIYREGLPGKWDAYPLNPSFLPLAGNDVDLQVVAVMIGAPRHRWG